MKYSVPLALIVWITGIAAVGEAADPVVPAPPTAGAMAPDWQKMAATKIKDLTATLRVNDDETNYDELKRIGGAFATTYRVSKTINVTYEYPNKARFDGRALGAELSLVYNGDKKAYHTPIKSGVQDVAGQPGQKQSLLDLGIFAKDYLTTDYEPVFLRKEGSLFVYQLKQRGTDNKSDEVVWVDPKTSITVRRQSVNGKNMLTKELRYLKPQQIRPGIFVPTRIEIYNQFGKLGAVQDVSEIKVNLGVDDTLFDVS